jgi:hypothetical protein
MLAKLHQNVKYFALKKNISLGIFADYAKHMLGVIK